MHQAGERERCVLAWLHSSVRSLGVCVCVLDDMHAIQWLLYGMLACEWFVGKHPP